MNLIIESSSAMEKFGGNLAKICCEGFVIYLQGDLGVGKTVLVRGFLRSIGYTGHVHSPTFKLFELYHVGKQVVCHVDLYRLNVPEELVYLGVADYVNAHNIWLIEWAEKGRNLLPIADLECKINFSKNDHERYVETVAHSSRGANALRKI